MIKLTNICLSLIVICSGSVQAESSVIGKTYPISEMDALDEIKSKAQKIPRSAFLKPQSDWSAMGAISLPVANETLTRKHIPWYVTQFDIKNPKGQTLYPKGFRFNPLQYVKLPQRIVVLREGQAVWYKKQHQKYTDMVLLTDGSHHKVSQYLDAPVFLLDKDVKKRLGLTFAPSILRQEKSYLLISEYQVELQPIPESHNDKDSGLTVSTAISK